MELGATSRRSPAASLTSAHPAELQAQNLNAETCSLAAVADFLSRKTAHVLLFFRARFSVENTNSLQASLCFPGISYPISFFNVFPFRNIFF